MLQITDSLQLYFVCRTNKEQNINNVVNIFAFEFSVQNGPFVWLILTLSEMYENDHRKNESVQIFKVVQFFSYLVYNFNVWP